MTDGNYWSSSYVNEYTKSEMYGFVHNTVLPNIRRSGLNITAGDLISASVYNDIVWKTGIISKKIIEDDGPFWLTDQGGNAHYFAAVTAGDIKYGYGVNPIGYESGASYGVRPLITVVR